MKEQVNAAVLKRIATKKKWREANREKIKENHRKWREANREKRRENDRKYREANPEKIKECHRKWRERNHRNKHSQQEVMA